MAQQVYLAADLGASNGRVVAGLFDGRQIVLDEIHRFENGPVTVNGSKFWDLLALWRHILAGLRQGAERYRGSITSVGVDTWGVDFGLLGRGDALLGNPYHYRDSRTDGILEKAFAIVPPERIFAATGLQFMPFNTLYQLLAMRLGGSPLLDVAERLLLMPDLLHWMLSGAKAVEQTNASTTQFFNPVTGAWATDLLRAFDLPTAILGDIVEPGTNLGPLLPDVARETDLHGVNVVVPATHDTASAVLAVPAAGSVEDVPDWCFISSGTWSLMGVEIARPLVNETCRELNFTNEVGAGGTIRLLKNIAGLWLLQESRRIWAEQGNDHTWDELNQQAEFAAPQAALVDPDHPMFLAPRDMPVALRRFCERTGQTPPATVGAVVRTVLDSLALKYRFVLEMLERLIGREIKTIHVVGGGSMNRPLCQATASACGRAVLAGPVEATVLGNVLQQAISAGAIGSIAEGRALIAASGGITQYAPHDTARWDEAYGRFRQIVERGRTLDIER